MSMLYTVLQEDHLHQCHPQLASLFFCIVARRTPDIPS